MLTALAGITLPGRVVDYMRQCEEFDPRGFFTMGDQNPNLEVTVKIEKLVECTIGDLRRFSGFIKVRGMIDVISTLDLEANPRSAKKSAVTSEIITTIREDSELYFVKSKGVLLGAADYVKRERDRLTLNFTNPRLEGILDGGHNTLSIALYLLDEAILLSDDDDVISDLQKKLKGVTRWDEMKKMWRQMEPELKRLKAQQNASLDALLQIEILVPNLDSVSGQEKFLNNILGICAARNNNVQLKAETIANQSGVFEYLKRVLEEQMPDVGKNVGWKTNEPGEIDLRVLLAMAWIPLGVIDLPAEVHPILGTSAYSSKAEVFKRFDMLIRNPKVSSKGDADNEKTWNITNAQVRSALEMVPQVLKTYDLIYKGYQDAYNANNGKFGRIKAVRHESKQKKNLRTPFSREPLGDNTSVAPAGFIMPIAYSMRELIAKNPKTGVLEWVIDPIEFYGDKDNLAKIIGSLFSLLNDVDFDPQRVGKSETSYTQAANTVKAMRLEIEKQRAAIAAQEEISAAKEEAFEAQEKIKQLEAKLAALQG